LQRKNGYDLLLIVYKPIETNGLYSKICGFSYGLSMSKGLVFSLNNALVFNIRTMELLTTTSIKSELDFVAGFFVSDKNIPSNDPKNINAPIQMINTFNQEFAVKVNQCLKASKQELSK